MNKQLTPAQREAVLALQGHAGRLVYVLTGNAPASMPLNTMHQFVARISGPALRGLASRGIIKIEHTFWRGALIEIPADIVNIDTEANHISGLVARLRQLDTDTTSV